MTSGHDVVVVGAGSAGCVVAARLSEDPRCRVLLLEAGPDLRPGRRPESVAGASFLDAMGEPGLAWPDLQVRRSSGQEPRWYVRGRGVGGSSAINAMVAIPGEPGDYDRWAELGATGWGWAEVEPWFRRTALSLLPAAVHERGPVARALHAVWPETTEWVPLTRDAVGQRVSAADAYLEPARDRPNLEVRANTLVDRLRFDARRCTGVRLASGETISAERVVLSAGAIHTPAILLRSGLDRPGIGYGIKDHASVPITLQCPPGGGSAADSLVVSAVTRLSSPGATNDLQVLPMEHLGRAAPGFAMTMVALMQVRSEGRVVVVSDDPTIDPVVEFAMLSDEDDRQRLRHGAELLLAGLGRPEFSAVGVPMEPDLSDEGLPAGLGDYVHASCSARMGAPDDPMAVVDPDGALIGSEGVFIADASVFPDLPRANTHLPVVMLAERLSARWKVLRQ